MIAEKAVQSGDARLVIELIKAAGEASEFRQDAHTERRITIQDVYSQDEVLAIDVISEIQTVDDLKIHAMLVLLSICRRLRKEESMTTGDVEQLYAVVCEEYGQKMKSHTTLWKYLKELEKRQIIVSRIASISDGRGRTTHLSMPHFLPTDLVNRVEMLLKKRLK